MSDYFKVKAANVSKLKILLDKTPAHLKHEIENPSDTDSECLIIGRAIHAILFESYSVFSDQFGILPEGHGATKEVKEAKAAILNAGKTPLSQKQYDLVLNLEMALKSNDTIADLLSEGEGEKEIYGQIDGIGCKAKLDWYRNGIIVDLKTVQDGVASTTGFAKQVVNYHYDLQAYLYMKLANQVGLDVKHFIFVVVEKTNPFLTAVYIATNELLENGERKCNLALKKWSECHSLDKWQGYPLGIQELTIPEWGKVFYE